MPHAEHSAEHHGHHIVPQKVLLKIFGALVGLTVLTVVTATQLDLGIFDVPLALAIAGAKAALVVMFFMALKYDNPVNTLTFTMGTVFVVVFLAFTLLDSLFRGDLGNVDVRTIQEIEREEEALRAREPSPEQLRVAPGDFVQQDTAATQGGGASQAPQGGAPAQGGQGAAGAQQAPAQGATQQ